MPGKSRAVGRKSSEKFSSLLSFSLLMTGSVREGEEATAFAYRALHEEAEKGSLPRDRELFLLRAAASWAWERERKRGGEPFSPQPPPPAFLTRRGRRVLSSHPRLPYALAALPFEERAALLLRYLLRKDLPRAAEILGRDEWTTLRLLSRARLRLLSLLGEPLPAPEELPPACASLLPYLLLRSENALPRKKEAHLLAHLSSCPTCALIASRLRKGGRLLRRLPALLSISSLLGGVGGSLLALGTGTPTGAVGAVSAGAGLPTGAMASASAGLASTSGGALAALGSLGLAGKIAVGLTTLALVGGVATGGYYGVRKLTGGPGSPSGGSGGRYARVALVRGGDIWIAEGDGEALRNERQLTYGGGNEAPGWSPDGREIAYIHNDENIMAVDEEGRTRYLLTAEEWHAHVEDNYGGFVGGSKDILGIPQFAPDGRYLYFTSQFLGGAAGAAILRKNMATNFIEPVLGVCYEFTLSGKGDMLALVREWSDADQSYHPALYLYRGPDDREGRRIGSGFYSPGSFNREGTRIAAFEEDSSTVCLFDLEGNLLRTLQAGNLQPSGSPRFTPDEDHLTFAVYEGGEDFNLYSISLTDGRVKMLSRDCEEAEWSPVYYEVSLGEEGAGEAGGGMGKIAYERDGDVYLYDLDREEERKLVSDGTAIDPYISLDGSKVAFVSYRDRLVYEERAELSAEPIRKGQIYEVDVASGKVRRLVDMPEANCYSPCYSPDGRFLAFARETFGEYEDPNALIFNVQLCLLDLQSGEWKVLGESTNGWEWSSYLGLDFAGGGRELVCIDSGEGVVEAFLMPVSGGEERSLDREHGLQDVFAVAFSHDGRTMVAEHGAFTLEENPILVKDLSSGAVRSLPPLQLYSEGEGALRVCCFSPDDRLLLFGISVSTPYESQYVKPDNIYVVTLEGADPRKVTTGRNPTWGR